jgi:ribose-phosphate pyrophosphokinase
VHNHSYSVMNIFKDRLNGHFHNLEPADVYAGYIRDTDIVEHKDLILCAPDKGALPFVESVSLALGDPGVQVLGMKKERKGERSVCTEVAGNSCIDLSEVEGRDVLVIDDMVRTGSTIVECCRLLRTARPRRIVFMVTHFYSSQECRVNLNDPAIDEIVTTSSIPQILNRDIQGRLRHKMVVLRIPRWISHHLLTMFDPESRGLPVPHYIEDMSSKNPRFRGRLGPLFSQYYDG